MNEDYVDQPQTLEAALECIRRLTVERDQFKAERDRARRIAVGLEQELADIEDVEPYPVLAWIYRTEDMTEGWQGWRRPISLGTDIQAGCGWRTVMVRVPGRRYVIVRLWPLREDGGA